MKLFKFSLRKTSGQSMVEFVMVVPLFFLLVFGMIDIGRAMFVQMTLQNAMRQAGRFAVTGNHLTNGGTNLTRVASIKQVVQNASMGLQIDPAAIDIRSIDGGVTTTNSAGGPGATEIISLQTTLQLITPMIGRFFGPSGSYTFKVSTTFRNEPFPPSQTL